MTSTDRLAEMAAEIERLRARITELEDQLEVRKALARNALAYALEQGSLAKPTPDEPVTITHNIPPSAPPHDE